MAKKILIVSMFGFFLIAGLHLAHSQQKEPDPEIDSVKKLSEVEEKLNTVSKNMDTVLTKLSQVLTNQEKIFTELEIIKVRATRK